MIYCNLEELQWAGGQAEPPMPAGPPLQVLGAWEHHLDPSTGRCFFYNPQMGMTSWKPHPAAPGGGGHRRQQGGVLGPCQPPCQLGLHTPMPPCPAMSPHFPTSIHPTVPHTPHAPPMCPHQCLHIVPPCPPMPTISSSCPPLLPPTVAPLTPRFSQIIPPYLPSHPLPVAQPLPLLTPPVPSRSPSLSPPCPWYSSARLLAISASANCCGGPHPGGPGHAIP